MNLKIVLIGLVLLTVAYNVRAITIDGTCDTQSVQCDLQINDIEVCNNEGFTQTITPSVSGEYGEWIRVLPESFTLESNECQTAEVYTIAPCYQEPGNYNALITFNGTNPVTLACEMELHQGHFLDVEIHPSQKNVSQCEETTFEITLTNNTIVPNQEQELVNLSIEGLEPEMYSLQTQQTIVTNGNERTIDLKVLPACTQEFGDYEFEVKARLFNPNFYSTDNATLSVFQGQQLNINQDGDIGSGTQSDPFIACSDKQTIIPLTIENTGKKNDSLKLTIEGPSFVKLSQNTIDIEEGNEEQVNLIIEKNDQENKLEEIEVTFESQLYNFSETRTFYAKIDDCYNAILEFPSGQENICTDKEQELEFTVRNDKKNPIELSVEVEGIPATLNQPTISLAKFEEKKFKIKVNGEQLTEEGTAQEKPIAVELIFDASASMNLPIGNQKKIDSAKNAVLSFTRSISPINIGLRVFGHNEACESSELIVPIKENSLVEIEEKIKSIQTAGQTPLAKTLTESISDFENKSGEKYIILISDGKESCDGDIEKTAQELSDKNIKIYAIGFDIDETGKKQLQKITSATNGQYFDAQNTEELFQTFQEITKELEIEISKEVQKTFTLKLSSENFSIEKDYTINASDCHNIAVFAPDLLACENIAGKEIATVTNIGTKRQEIKFEANPDFIKLTPSQLTLESGQTSLIEINFETNDLDAQNELEIRATTPNTSTISTSNITYLSQAACHGFDMIIPAQEFVGRIGEGERRKILFINQGRSDMEISLKGDQPWIYFEPEKIILKKGQTSFANFYITPPFDFTFLENDVAVKITAENEFGISVQKEAKLVVTGPTFGLVPQDIEVKTIIASSVSEKDLDKDIEVNFTLENESDRTIEVLSIEIPSTQTSVSIAQNVLKIGEKTTVKILADVGDKTGRIMLPLIITTTDGSIVRELNFERIVEEPEKNETNDNVDPQTGFSSLINIQNVGIAIALIVVVIILAFVIGKPKQEQNEPQENPMQETFNEITKPVEEKPKKESKKKPVKKIKAKKRTEKAAPEQTDN